MGCGRVCCVGYLGEGPVAPRCAIIDTGGGGGGRTLLTPAGARSANICGAAPSTFVSFASRGRTAVSSNAASDALMSSTFSRL